MNSEPIKNIILNWLRLDSSLVEIERYISVQAGGYTQEEADDAYNAVHDICNDMAYGVVEHFGRVLDGKDRRIAELEKLCQRLSVNQQVEEEVEAHE